MFHKNKRETLDFDRENLRPVIRSSICTGERVAGFKDRRSGRISEVMLIRSEGDFDEFRTKERHRDDGDFAVHLPGSEAAKARHRKLREIADFVGRHGIEASDGIAEGDAYGSERCESKTSDPHGSNRRLCVLCLHLELWSNAKGDIDDVYTRLLSVIDINYLFHRQNCIVCVSLFCEAPDDSFDSNSM